MIRTYKIRVLAILLGLVGGISVYATNIMCVGDSITQGYNDGNGNGFDRSYRYEFWKLLVDNNHDFDLVGGRDFPASKWGAGVTISPSAADLAAMYPSYAGKVFDGGHEAAWGNTTASFIRGDGYGLDALTNRLATLSATEKPDIVLLHLGTNDPGKKITPSESTNNLATIVGHIRDVNPNVRIMMAQLIPRLRTDPDPVKNAAEALNNAGVTNINNIIPALALSLNTANSPVEVVDFRSVLTINDLGDEIHPNPAGEAKMAMHWYGAISNYVSIIGGPLPNKAPSAAITVDKSAGLSPLVVAFSGSTSSDSDGTISSYAWDFDDGTTSSLESPSHTYTNSGSYTATLTVTDEDGAKSTASILIVAAQQGAGATDLVLQYKFNETSGTSVTDSSVNSYDGTAANGINWTPGKFGNAVEFVGGKVEVPVSIFNQLTNNQMTVSVWMYDDGLALNDPINQALIYGSLNGADYYQMGFWSIPRFSIKIAGQSASYNGVEKADFCGAWNHWAFVSDGSAITVYRNGALEHQVNSVVTLNAPDEFILGQRTNGSNEFTGKMDDFRIYKSALSATEILGIMLSEEAQADHFSAWAGQEGIPTDPEGDHDGDGVKNFTEYAFGLDPHVGDKPSAGSFSVNTAGDVTYSFPKPISAVTHTVQYSTNMVNWMNSVATETEVNGEISTVLSSSLSGNNKLFLRIRLEE